MFHGAQEPSWPVEPYEFIVWWHCGYPPSDAACGKGWQKLNQEVGIGPDQLLRVSQAKLISALRPGGMVPELRAQRLKEVALRMKNEFAGDLRAALNGPISTARKKLKMFPGIADPGADRILLFGNLSPIAAVPSLLRHSVIHTIAFAFRAALNSHEDVRTIRGNSSYGRDASKQQDSICAGISDTRKFLEQFADIHNRSDKGRAEVTGKLIFHSGGDFFEPHRSSFRDHTAGA